MGQPEPTVVLSTELVATLHTALAILDEATIQTTQALPASQSSLKKVFDFFFL